MRTERAPLSHRTSPGVLAPRTTTVLPEDRSIKYGRTFSQSWCRGNYAPPIERQSTTMRIRGWLLAAAIGATLAVVLAVELAR